jgi:nucleoid DNA-binding protein
MTKTDLIQRIAENTQRTKKEAEEAIEGVLATIAETLSNGEKVDLRGFGSFQVSEKGERQGRNPRTGEAMTIAARKVAVFKPSKELAERVNGKSAAAGESKAAQDDMPEAEPSSGSTKVHGDKIT